MCPGGRVVAAASEEGGVVTNGMSEFARDGENANAALLCNVEPEDFGEEDVLAGVEFQRKYERLAFELGGRNYHAPAQTVGDFLAGHASTALGKVAPSYAPGVTLTDLAGCLPGFAVTTLRSAIVIFDKRLRGYAQEDAVLTGVETRSSSPVRILRGENCQSNLKGVISLRRGRGLCGRHHVRRSGRSALRHRLNSKPLTLGKLCAKTRMRTGKTRYTSGRKGWFSHGMDGTDEPDDGLHRREPFRKH